MEKQISLTPKEQNVLTEVLFNAKTNRKMKSNYNTIDRVIDKITDRVTYVKRRAPHVLFFDGKYYNRIYVGGKFQSEHGIFTIENIDGQSIKVNGRWHHKDEFEPATIISDKGKVKGMLR